MKKLLFIQGGSRVRVSKNNHYYVDGNFNNVIWKRYKSYSSDFTAILRRCADEYEEDKIRNKYNAINTNIVNLKLVDDIYSPKINFFKLNKKLKIKKIIKQEVLKADKVIIRSIGNFYTNTALKYCKKFKKDYLIEVTGFAFEGLWYHSSIGKILAIPRELKLKFSLKKAPYAVYVTKEALQKRYPCKGYTLGCSDVVIDNMDENILKKKNNFYENLNETYKFKLGTAAFLDVNWKGQIYVVKALAKLKQKGITNLEYQMIGSGTGNKIKNIAKKFGVNDQIKILGTLPHEQVFNWLDTIDIYIQPSFQEGLCRAIVEAMSRACPIICSNTGGNYELANKEFLFKKGNTREIVSKVLKMQSKSIIMNESKRSFEEAKKFKKEDLDKKRDEFYRKFINK